MPSTFTVPGLEIFASGSRLVTPDARFARTKMGRVVRSNSPGSSWIESTRARCWARRKPWVLTAALGCPVLPLVNVMRAESARSGCGSSSGVRFSLCKAGFG